ncbi:hypothetical protein HHI36_003335 [Cryptolaemus montrouzieri]|uniref:Uncharacterized protein n=1 Tax=Cryptolaemus montrouzieri TaxID=559131 RepID=A0ABD2PEK3_9CUCU
MGDFNQELYMYKDRNIEINNPNVPKVLNQGSEEIPEITEDEILSALKEMKDDKATGEDGIEIEAIKYGGEEIIKALKVLLNKCLIKEFNQVQKTNSPVQINAIHKSKGGNGMDIRGARSVLSVSQGSARSNRFKGPKNWYIAKCGFPLKSDDLLNTVHKINSEENRPNPFMNNRPGKN